MNAPRDGYVADIMRRTRALYHYTIRKLKNNAELLRKSAMARAINDSNCGQKYIKLEIKILLLVIVSMMYLVMLILQTYSLTNTLYCIILLLLKNLLWIIYY